jgi:tRNA A37 methylthiotransferase MiaB
MSMVDTVQMVLVEGLSKKNQLQVTGRTENNRVVNFIGHSLSFLVSSEVSSGNSAAGVPGRAL